MSQPALETSAPEIGGFVTNAFGDSYLPSVNGTLFRDRPAAQVYAERFTGEPFKEHSLYIVCGTDSGLFLKYLLSLPAVEGTTFLFIERPEVAQALPVLLPELESAQHIRVSSLDDLSAQAKALQIAHFFYRKALFLVPSFSLVQNPSPAYADLAWRAQQTLDRLSLELGVCLNNRFFFLTMLQNLAENRTSVHVLDGVFAGRTAIVLGAGPSLDEVLPWVKKNRHKVDLLAVSRTSKRLLQSGIHPDFVFSIDPQTISFDVGREMLRFGEDTVFVNNTHACPQLVGQWPWRNLYWGTRLPWLAPTDASPGNTVTHLALWTAIRFGYSRIILAGVDLCFSREGHTHAQGSAERDAGPNLTRGAVEVETNSGELAETDHQMAKGIEEMGQLALAAKQRGISVVNPAARAARVPNVQHTTLDGLVFQQDPESVRSLLDRALPAEGPAERVAYYREALEDLSKTKRDLRRIQSWSRSALDNLRRAFAQTSSPAYQKRIKKVDAVEAKLRRTYPGLRSALIQLQANEFTGVLRANKSDWDSRDVEEASRLVFNGYIRSADDLITHLESVVSRLQSRVNEEEPSGRHLPALADQWDRDQQPGRGRIWQIRNRETLHNLNEETLSSLSRTDELFEAALVREREARRTMDPSAVCRRAVSMFERRDMDGLARTAAGLTEYDDHEAEALRLLIEGFTAELLDRPEEGLNSYRKAATSASDAVRTEALRRSSVILLKAQQLDAALDVLRELCSVSKSHRPSYARALRVAGRAQEAIEQYTAHLSDHPSDTGTMLQLGDLYRDLGVDQSARLAYEYVLSVDPNDIVVRHRLTELGHQGSPA